MKKMPLLLFFLLAPVSAAPILTVTPSTLLALPGTTVAWSFTMTPDPVRWVTSVTSFLLVESDDTFGTYTDVIGTLGGPVNAVLAPGSPDWSDTLGLYEVSLTPATELNSGVIRVLYEEYSGDPNSCGDCYVGPGELDVAFTATTVPEPATSVLLLSAGAALALVRRRIRAREIMLQSRTRQRL